jgi:hypothetical protein
MPHKAARRIPRGREGWLGSLSGETEITIPDESVVSLPARSKNDSALRRDELGCLAAGHL